MTARVNDICYETFSLSKIHENIWFHIFLYFYQWIINFQKKYKNIKFWKIKNYKTFKN